MKNIIHSYIFFFIFIVCSMHAGAAGYTGLHDALLKLDSLIKAKPLTHARHEAKLDSLKREVARTDDSWQKYMLYGSLFYEYLHYQADSSFYYVDKKAEMLPLIRIPGLENEVLINRAEVYGVMGLRLETEYTLRQVDLSKMESGMKQYYYSTCCAHYTNMTKYVSEKYEIASYAERANQCRDSIFFLNPDGANYDLLFSEKLLVDSPDRIIASLQNMLEQQQDGKTRTILYYTLAEAYKVKNDTVGMMYNLAQTAILDLQHAVREYAALQKLSWLLFLKGDVKRAYEYAACSTEDAAACYARLRAMESGNFYAIMQNAFNKISAEEYKATRRLLLVGTILFVLLTVMVAALLWWTKKMTEMRAELAVANEKLETSNKELAMTGKIKETYIAHYLDKCVNYLNQIELYRRSLEKLAMKSEIENLFKAIRSTNFIRDERKRFYAEFDHSFLELFPDFVKQFNELLVEGEEICVKPGELLCTELRIFALIRLGVTDSNRIAHFLSYSLATIYNYRSKLRSKARGDKNTFEQRVMELAC